MELSISDVRRNRAWRLQQLRDLRHQHSAATATLFADPASDILLALYLHPRPVDAASIARAGGAQEAVGRRWLRVLIERGLVEYASWDATSAVELSDEGRAAMDEYLDASGAFLQ